jgi:hypothetical protein
MSELILDLRYWGEGIQARNFAVSCAALICWALVQCSGEVGGGWYGAGCGVGIYWGLECLVKVGGGTGMAERRGKGRYRGKGDKRWIESPMPLGMKWGSWKQCSVGLFCWSILEDRGLLIVESSGRLMLCAKEMRFLRDRHQMEEVIGCKVTVKGSNMYYASLLQTVSCIMQREFKAVKL